MHSQIKVGTKNTRVSSSETFMLPRDIAKETLLRGHGFGQTRVRNSETLTEGIPSLTPPPPMKIRQQGGHTVTGARLPLVVYFPHECWYSYE